MLMCMYMLIKRAHILFDQQLWNQLVQKADEKQTSVAQLVRVAVEEKYQKENFLSERARAINKILALKKQYKTKPVKKESAVELVRRMRDERTQHIWNVLERNMKKSE